MQRDTPTRRSPGLRRAHLPYHPISRALCLAISPPRLGSCGGRLRNFIAPLSMTRASRDCSLGVSLDFHDRLRFSERRSRLLLLRRFFQLAASSVDRSSQNLTWLAHARRHVSRRRQRKLPPPLLAPSSPVFRPHHHHHHPDAVNFRAPTSALARRLSLSAYGTRFPLAPPYSGHLFFLFSFASFLEAQS